jgi:hypothetical protein
MDGPRKLDGGSLVMETPLDPKSGATSITLDALEWIHRITSHIPDPDAIVRDFTGPIPTAGGFPRRLRGTVKLSRFQRQWMDKIHL